MTCDSKLAKKCEFARGRVGEKTHSFPKMLNTDKGGFVFRLTFRKKNVATATQILQKFSKNNWLPSQINMLSENIEQESTIIHVNDIIQQPMQKCFNF